MQGVSHAQGMHVRDGAAYVLFGRNFSEGLLFGTIALVDTAIPLSRKVEDVSRPEQAVWVTSRACPAPLWPCVECRLGLHDEVVNNEAHTEAHLSAATESGGTLENTRGQNLAAGPNA